MRNMTAILAAVAVSVCVAGAGRAWAYEATYSVGDPVVSSPTVAVISDPTDGLFGYGLAFYTPTTDQHVGGMHVTFDPRGPAGTEFWVMGWLSGDLAGLTDTVQTGYEQITEGNDPIDWAAFQLYAGVFGHGPFNYLLKFDTPVVPGGGLDFHWDVGSGVTVERFAVVPEPATLGLLGLGVMGLVGRRRG